METDHRTQLVIPAANRFFMIGTEDEVAIKTDSTLQSYWAFSRPEALAAGSIGNLHGFDLYPSTRLPAVGGTPSGHAAFCGTPESMIMVTRPNADIPDGVGVQVASVTDPISGLSLRVLKQYDMNYRGVRVGIDILYGYSKLRDLAGVYAKTK